MRCVWNICAWWWSIGRKWVDSIYWDAFKYRGLFCYVHCMSDPTDRTSLGLYQGCPFKYLLLLNGISMIDTWKLLLVDICFCVAPVVSFCLKEVVMPHMELRLSVSCGKIQDRWDGSWMVGRWTQINAKDWTTFPFLGSTLLGFCCEHICWTSKGVVLNRLRRHINPRKCL